MHIIGIILAYMLFATPTSVSAPHVEKLTLGENTLICDTAEQLATHIVTNNITEGCGNLTRPHFATATHVAVVQFEGVTYHIMLIEVLARHITNGGFVSLGFQFGFRRERQEGPESPLPEIIEPAGEVL